MYVHMYITAKNCMLCGLYMASAIHVAAVGGSDRNVLPDATYNKELVCVCNLWLYSSCTL
jgi:hypothetical protein